MPRASLAFGPGALASGFLVLLALNLINPDALIARTNVVRAVAGRSFDAAYAARLSADALPTLLRLLPALPPPDRCAVSAALHARWNSELASGVRWNISVSRASRLLGADIALPPGGMLAASCPPIQRGWIGGTPVSAQAGLDGGGSDRSSEGAQ